MKQSTTVRRCLAATASVLLLLLGACAPSTSQSSSTPTGSATETSSRTPTPSASTPPATGSITVLAPGTLANAVPALNGSFTSSNPDATVTPNLGHSPAQVIALQQGSPGDVFITIGADSMVQAQSSSLLSSSPVIFARNRFVIVVPKGNPKHITAVSDLPNVTTVLADTSTPGGMMTDQLLKKDNVTVNPVSREQGPPAVVQKVATGNADAGLAFETDVQGNDQVEGIPIPDDQQVPVLYEAATLAKSNNPKAAQAYVNFLNSAAGQQVLQGMQFLAP
ncbi:molybdate ABC transporter substrate-binding protein [Propionibacterium sp.]|uniref:molybdate ABC transporter substrate-binding protein n=1 Tax=Propionibacterium sp. TaxID=1977903 RepID=UPI0039EA4FDF